LSNENGQTVSEEFAMPIPASSADWTLLQSTIAGQLILPNSDAYRWAHRSFIARFDNIEPKAVVRCASPEDVAEVIQFARHHGMETATRSGGHSSAGYSSTEGILIDLAPMCSVVVGNGIVEVGAGARLENLNECLLERDLTVPSGTCPSVGIGGLTLGGGIGILGRRYGLTLDHLLQAQVVLADSQVIRCDEQHHADLFWALRGAGSGNFGVVTSFTFEPVRVVNMTNFRLTWPWTQAAKVIAAWERWAPSGPEELSADLVLSDGNLSSEPVVEVHGAIVGSESASELLEKLALRVGDPRSEFCGELSYRETVQFQAERTSYDWRDETPDGPISRLGHRGSRSEFFDRILPDDATRELVDTFTEMRLPGQHRSLGFAPWGGAYNRRLPEATAFVHRDQLFLLEHTVSLDSNASDTDKHVAHQWMSRSGSSVHPWASGHVYPNFAGPDLNDWGHAYYGSNYSSLLKVKAQYDRDGVFRFRQSLPVR
jgi:FAD/FMN-containing dehydrogenase